MKHYLTLIGVVALAVIVGVAGGYLSRKAHTSSLQAFKQSHPMTREQMARLIAQTAARSAARAANSVLVQQAAVIKRQRLVASVETRGTPSGESMQGSSGLKAR